MSPEAKKKAGAAAVAILVGITPAYEGVRLVAYKDPPGIPTICAGHTHGVKMGDRATPEQCRKLLGEDLWIAVATVQRCVPYELTPGQLAAFSDLVFNIGPTPVCNTRSSTMARYLAAGKVEAACGQLPRWDKAKVLGIYVTLPGLTKRRLKERELCMGAPA